MIRSSFLKYIREGFRTSPIVAILGPRQCGKTTIAQEYWDQATKNSRTLFRLRKPT